MNYLHKFELGIIGKILRFLISTPKRAAVLLPLTLVASYTIGFGGMVLVSSLGYDKPTAVTGNPEFVRNQLLVLVPLAHAATGPKACGVSNPCNPLDPKNYTDDSDFYTTSAGVDFTFRVAGEPNVGYINVNSPQKTVTKRFD